VDRDAIARRRRRGQALEALAFEREREAALVEQLEEVVLEEEGPRIDREAFARLQPEDVAAVRGILDGWSEPDDEEEADELEDDFFAGLETAGEEPAPDEEDEVARLQGEIEASRARQRALGRYLDALAAPSAPADG
jgi:hypothetical protein